MSAAAADRFTAMFGNTRRGHTRRHAPNRPPQTGDQAYTCPNPDCDTVHYGFMTDDPHISCPCGVTFNCNYAPFAGRILDDGTLDTADVARANERDRLPPNTRRYWPTPQP